METNKDFEEFIKLLNENKVRYLIVGGYAYAIHAEPRYTKDLDIFYEPSQTNAGRLLQTLQQFGMESLSLTVDDFTTQGQIIQIGYEPLRIDLINEIDGLTFRDAWDNKEESRYGDQTIYVISKSDLIKNKKTSGREQDMLDVKKLKES
ncbi:MAG: nucleotidyltransferase [Balneolaceae bacterium]|nr:nucleotidyltransferase [Balneolaceae bacterium]